MIANSSPMSEVSAKIYFELKFSESVKIMIIFKEKCAMNKQNRTLLKKKLKQLLIYFFKIEFFKNDFS